MMGHSMIRAKLYTQGPPIASGYTVVDGERVQAYEANLIDKGIVEGVTRKEIWLRAKAITPAPVMEWLS